MLTGLTAIWAMLGGEAAAAEPAAVLARLEWGTSVCGDAEGFASRVSKRSLRVRFVERAPQVRVLLSIRPEGAALAARVRLEGPGRPALDRHILSPDCDDALDALALVVAITLEGWPAPPRRAPPPRRTPRRVPVPPPATELPVPEARAEPPAALETAPSPDEPAIVEPLPNPLEPPSPPPTASTSEPTAAVEGTPPAPEPPVVMTPLPLGPPEADGDAAVDGPALRLSAALAVQWLAGLAPAPIAGGGLFLRATWDGEGVLSLSPEFGLGFTHHRGGGFQEPGGEAAFALDSGTLEFCPLRIGNADIALRPCALGSLGRLTATGERTFDGHSRSRPWATAGGGLVGSARWGVFEFRLAGAFSAPFVRDSFSFGSAENGGSVFDRVDAGVWLAGAAVGVLLR
jgi:hypothetical protein